MFLFELLPFAFCRVIAICYLNFKVGFLNFHRWILHKNNRPIFYFKSSLSTFVELCPFLKGRNEFMLSRYYINITFPERVIVDNIIPRNVIINRGAAEVDNHISRDDIVDYHPLRECNIYFIIPNTTLDSLFSSVRFLLDLPW